MSEEKALLEKLGQGDRKALKEFFDTYYSSIKAFVMRIVKDPMMAESVASDVILEVIKVADTFQGNSKLRTWVLGIAKFKAYDEMRRQAKFFREETGHEQMPEEETPVTDKTLSALENSDVLRHCLEQLSDDHRMVIHLRYYQDFSYDEIATTTEIPVGTVRSRIYNARNQLKDCVSSQG